MSRNRGYQTLRRLNSLPLFSISSDPFAASFFEVPPSAATGGTLVCVFCTYIPERENTRGLPSSRLIPRATLQNHGRGQHLERHATDFALSAIRVVHVPCSSHKRGTFVLLCSGVKKSSTYNFQSHLSRQKMSQEDGLKRYKSYLGSLRAN